MAHRVTSAEPLRDGAVVAAGARAQVRVPASTANLGPGFDFIGMALGVWDEAEAIVEGDSLVVEATGFGEGEVPLDESHLAYRAMVAAWQALGLDAPQGLRLSYRGAIPHSRGMGSSASAAVTGVALGTALAGLDLADDTVLRFVSDIASSIEGHPDNASASVYGNVTVSWAGNGDAGDWRSAVLAPHPHLVPVLVVPQRRLSTATARAALPTAVPLAVAARNSGRTALLAHALTADPSLLMPATQDYLHQEARRPAYPESMALVDALRDAGIPAVISGAGPTVLALTSGQGEEAVRAVASDVEIISPGTTSRGVHVVSSS